MLSTRELNNAYPVLPVSNRLPAPMEMVAASRLKEVESRVISLGPRLREDASGSESRLISAVRPKKSHPLFTDKEHEAENVRIVLITGDKGLCGAYNNNIIKKVVGFIQAHTSKKLN